MSAVINIQAEDLMGSMTGVSGGQDLIGFLLSPSFLPFPRREVSHMLSINPNPLSTNLLSVSHYRIAVLINLQEQTSSRI